MIAALQVHSMERLVPTKAVVVSASLMLSGVSVIDVQKDTFYTLNATLKLDWVVDQAHQKDM